jgi:WD40 repeat protein
MASQVFPGTQLGDTAVAIWDLAKRQIVRQISWPNADFLGSIGAHVDWPDLSAKGELLYGAQYQSAPGTNSSYTQELRIESLVDPTKSTAPPDPYRSCCLALTSDGRTLAGAYAYSVDANGQGDWWVWYYNLALGAFTGGFDIGDRPVSKISFSPDGTQLVVLRQNSWPTAVGRPTKGLSVWQVPDGQLLWEASAHTLCAQDLAFSPDGATLVVVGGGDDAATDCAGVESYDARHGTRLGILDQSPTGRSTVRFSPDGRYVMAPASGDGISIWRTADWQRYNTFGVVNGTDAVFLPQNQGVLEIATGVVWCPN